MRHKQIRDNRAWCRYRKNQVRIEPLGDFFVEMFHADFNVVPFESFDFSLEVNRLHAKIHSTRQTSNAEDKRDYVKGLHVEITKERITVKLTRRRKFIQFRHVGTDQSCCETGSRRSRPMV